jgi:hypothetical protein
MAMWRMRLAAGFLLVFCWGAARAEDRPLFERDVLPILTAHCWKCHGSEDLKAGLDLRTPPLVFSGSSKGPVVVKGFAAQSRLYQMVSSGAMPPAKELKLSKAEVETIGRWIDTGGESARSYGALAKTEIGEVTEADRQFWAFRKPIRPAIPRMTRKDGAKTPVDEFLLARLRENKLGFSPRANRETLMRRAYFDLIGLPPTLQEADAFLADRTPDAFERLVDRLLASPHFGERWGRHWLDAAGYADVYGIDSNPGDIRTGEGKWRYRDYVTRAFNSDKPYDRFLTEQIAGDELVDWRHAKRFTPEITEALEATGFLRTAADDTNNDAINTALIRYRVLHLTVQNFTSGVLGLTVACAQCHTHKYDPIPQVDYYRMLAIFTPAYNPQRWLQTKDRYLPDVSADDKAAIDGHNAELNRQIEPLRTRLAQIRKPYEERLVAKKLASVPEAFRDDLKAALDVPGSKRSPVEQYLVRKLGGLVRVNPAAAEELLNADERSEYQAVSRQIRELEAQSKSYGKIQALYDLSPPPVTFLNRRGKQDSPAAEVEPGFLTVLTEPGKPVTIAAQSTGPSSGRRLALARWLTEPDTAASGLVARVMVNRMWQHLFGEGIVDPPDNFGKMGGRPTHPELLDWLATEFVRGGWRIKPMIRLVMSSAAYQQDSRRESPQYAESVDPGDKLLWRMRLRRLESEIVRDSILAVSGKLDESIGGAPIKMQYANDGRVLVSENDLPSPTAQWRRSLYLFTRRSYNLNLLSVFDEPVMDANCPKRTQSAVVLQSLTMLNDQFVLEQARYFAQRVARLAGDSAENEIGTAVRVALGRSPKPKEVEWTLASMRNLVDDYRSEGLDANAAREKALAGICHTLLNTNEFLYVQ